MQWTVTEVQRWAAWTLEQYKLPANHLNEFMIDGTSLCMLDEADFKRRSPQVGEYLFAQLEFWRNGKMCDLVVQHSLSIHIINV